MKLTPNRGGPRINEGIDTPNIQLIDATGNNVGVVAIADALARAAEAGLDLVEISPNADPPVCKILDFGKFKYQAQKKAAEARKKQRTVEIKEIKMRPNIDIHDYEVKMRAIVRFFEEGDKVKVTLRFRGREMAHMELGAKLLDRVKQDTSTTRQGRGRAEARRPADDDGARAALGFLRCLPLPSGANPPYKARFLEPPGGACRGGFHASTIELRLRGTTHPLQGLPKKEAKCPR